MGEPDLGAETDQWNLNREVNVVVMMTSICKDNPSQIHCLEL